MNRAEIAAAVVRALAEAIALNRPVNVKWDHRHPILLDDISLRAAEQIIDDYAREHAADLRVAAEAAVSLCFARAAEIAETQRQEIDGYSPDRGGIQITIDSIWEKLDIVARQHGGAA